MLTDKKLLLEVYESKYSGGTIKSENEINKDIDQRKPADWRQSIWSI